MIVDVEDENEDVKSGYSEIEFDVDDDGVESKVESEDEVEPAPKAEPAPAPQPQGVNPRLEDNLRRIAEERDRFYAASRVLAEENKELKRRKDQAEGGLFESLTQKFDSEIKNVQATLRNAVNENDGDAIAEASSKLAGLHAQRERVIAAANLREQRATEEAEAVQQQPTETRVQQTQAAPQPSPRAQEWVAKNKWFETDPAARNLALAVHQNLIQSGVQPDTDEYYDRLNSGVSFMRPDLIKTEEKKKSPAQKPAPVAPVARQSGKKAVYKMSPEEKKICAELGISQEKYARNRFAIQRRREVVEDDE